MARNVSIPITDDGDQCNNGYIVEYKLQGVMEYTVLYPQQFVSPITINGLLDDSVYDLRIMRVCCDGTTSDWAETTFDTTL